MKEEERIELTPEAIRAKRGEFRPSEITGKEKEELPPLVRQGMKDLMEPAIVRGAWEGIFALPNEARDIVLKATAKGCIEKVVEIAGVNPREMDDIDEFLVAWDKAFPGQRKLKREGDIIHWQFSGGEFGGCPCPMVRLGMIEPNPKQCLCSCHWVRHLVEMVVKRPVTVELLDSPLATGAENCQFLVHLKPPLETARR